MAAITTQIADTELQRDENGKEFTMYKIQVTSKDPLATRKTWEVLRRYSQFNELHSMLVREHPTAMREVTFPGKKLIGRFNPAFVDQRKDDLAAYLQHLLLLRIESRFLNEFLDYRAEPINKIDAMLQRAAQGTLPRPRGKSTRALPTASASATRTAAKTTSASSLPSESSINSLSQRLPTFSESRRTGEAALVTAADVSDEDIEQRLEEHILNVYSMLDQARGGLTHSQEQRLHMNLGNIHELRQKITLLIEASLDMEPDVLRNLTDLLDRVDYSMEMYDKMAMSYADEQGSAASSSSGSGTSGTDGDHDDDGGQGNSLVMSGLISTDAGDNAEFEAPEWPEGTNLDEERECPICLDDVALRDGMLLGCHDGSFYCNNCLSEYITSRIDNGQVLKMPCPNPLCGTEMNESVIEQQVSEQQYDRFQQFRFIASLRDEPNCRWCPRNGCETPCIADPTAPTHPELQCPVCDLHFCFDCNQEWHPNMTCAENRKFLVSIGKISKEHDRLYEQYRKKVKTMPCPGCRADVQKTEGCNHMTCTCGFQFCWLCGEAYTTYHFSDGPCAGKQFSANPRAEKAGMYALLIGGVVVGVPIALAGGAVALGVAIPALAVGAPIYGGYRLVKMITNRDS